MFPGAASTVAPGLIGARKKDVQRQRPASRFRLVLGKRGRPEVLGVAVLITIVVTIFCNAVGRYAFDAHLIWAEELVLMLMPWLAMTGTFLAVRRGTMIRIDYFYQRLPHALRRPIALAGYALCVVMLAFLGVISTRFVSLFGADASPYLNIATGWSTIALVIGGFGVSAAFLAVLMREFASTLGKR